MAKDIAALSSGDKTAFRSALSGMFYLSPIGDGVTVSTPVDHVDFDLPSSGYSSFLVTMAAVAPDGAPGNYFGLGAAFSADGSTFIADTDETDTYAYFAHHAYGKPVGGNVDPTLTFSTNYDVPAKLMGSVPFLYIYTADLWINPGGVGIYPSLKLDAFFRRTDDSGHFVGELIRSSCTFYPEAAVAPTLVRHTKVRLLSVNNPDPNDPTSSGDKFATGSHFNLYGVPSV